VRDILPASAKAALHFHQHPYVNLMLIEYFLCKWHWNCTPCCRKEITTRRKEESDTERWYS